MGDILERARKGIIAYRGEPPPEYKRGKVFISDPGDFGRGIYYTTLKARAKAVAGEAHVTQKEIEFDNPFIIDYGEAYATLVQDYNTLGHGIDLEARLRNCKRLTIDMLNKGYDGLIAVRKDKTGKVVELEIVDYRPYKTGGETMSNEHISDTGLGVGGAPRKGVPKTEKERKEEHIRRYGTEELPPRGSGLDSIDKYAGQPIILINIETGKVIPGGRVVSEEKALATGCHGYDIGEGKRMLWSKGVVGTLSLPEQEKYCKVGMDLKPMTGRLKKRITALREAGIEF